MRTAALFNSTSRSCTPKPGSRIPFGNKLRPLHCSKRKYRQSLSDSVGCISVGANQLQHRNYKKPSTPRDRRALCVKALVTFDYAQPALWLGAALISGGVFLLNLRNVQPVSSKDSDIVLSCILVFSGGILIFQGWRLDPLLLFVQICTTGTAFTWALESINLRKDINRGKQWDERSKLLPPDSRRRNSEPPEDSRFRLPAPEDSNYGQWYGNAEPGAEFQEQPSASGRGFYDGKGQEVYYQPAQGRESFYMEPSPQEREGYSEAGRGYDARVPPGTYYQPDDAGTSYYDESPEQRYPRGFQGGGFEEYKGPPEPYYQEREGRPGVGYHGSWGPEQPWEQGQGTGGRGHGEEADGDFKAGSSGPSSSRVVDDVENFYKRPESVVEDVERFYDSQGRPIYFPGGREGQETGEEQDWMDPGPEYGTQGGPSASGGPPSGQNNLREGMENDSRDQKPRGRF